MENDIFWAVSCMDYLAALDVNQQVEVFKEVCSKERDGNRSQLKIQGLNLGT